jgi:3,4-dihydroxy 2-butanone 4-phosphate synthase/GTP cyclohydrolase II
MSDLLSVQAAIAAIGKGGMVVVVDDTDRENEGDLVMAAVLADTAKMGFFVRHTSGLICVAITEARADQLKLPLMVSRNTESQRTAFTVTVDYRHGTSTGISASDRATTARALVDPATTADDLARPGHVHVLRSHADGVLGRPGHTEAAVDLVRLAGFRPAGVLCEVVSEDGLTMARGPELARLAKRYGLPMVTVSDLIWYRACQERLVRRSAESRVPTEWGEFTCCTYQSLFGTNTHLAFVMGDLADAREAVVHVHIECLEGDVFGSVGCDCRSRLHGAMRRIASAGVGAVVYLRGQETWGTGLSDELRAEALGASILVDLGVTTLEESGVGARVA